MIPKATPHTAQRKIGSQSPPRAIQRRPVIQTQATIASSSVSPYMCRVSGPRSTAPDPGEGIDASRRISAPFCP